MTELAEYQAKWWCGLCRHRHQGRYQPPTREVQGGQDVPHTQSTAQLVGQVLDAEDVMHLMKPVIIFQGQNQRVFDQVSQSKSATPGQRVIFGGNESGDPHTDLFTVEHRWISDKEHVGRNNSQIGITPRQPIQDGLAVLTLQANRDIGPSLTKLDYRFNEFLGQEGRRGNYRQAAG